MFKGWLEEGVNREDLEDMGQNINDIISHREIKIFKFKNDFFRIDIKSH